MSVLPRDHILLQEKKPGIDDPDHDDIIFKASCKGGTLDITINHQKENGSAELRAAKLRAGELYPLMCEHFEAKGNPVKRMEGLLAWDKLQGGVHQPAKPGNVYFLCEPGVFA